MTGFQRSARNWRAPEFSKAMNPHLSIALSPMFIAFLDRSIRKVPWMHEITHKIILTGASLITYLDYHPMRQAHTKLNESVRYGFGS